MTENYVRSDEEIAHQKRYEACENNRHLRIALQITYRIDPVPTSSDKSYIEARNPKGSWVVVRQIEDGKEERGAPHFRHYEALAAMREGVWRDKKAAERLGVDIRVIVGRVR